MVIIHFDKVITIEQFFRAIDNPIQLFILHLINIEALKRINLKGQPFNLINYAVRRLRYGM